MTLLMSRRSAVVTVSPPSGYPRKIRSVTPTTAAAAVCSARRIPAMRSRGTDRSKPPAWPSVTMQ